MIIVTTLNEIKENEDVYLRYEDNWEKLNEGLGSNYGDDTPLRFSQIAEIIGLEDTVKCLYVLDEIQHKALILFTVECAELVLPVWEKHSDNKEPHEALKTIKEFLEDKMSSRDWIEHRNESLVFTMQNIRRVSKVSNCLFFTPRTVRVTLASAARAVSCACWAAMTRDVYACINPIVRTVRSTTDVVDAKKQIISLLKKHFS